MLVIDRLSDLTFVLRVCDVAFYGTLTHDDSLLSLGFIQVLLQVNVALSMM